jgi:hypothetical protein
MQMALQCVMRILIWRYSGRSGYDAAMRDLGTKTLTFSLRLGKALDYEYNEDSQTGLFQRRDPREGK